MGVCTKEWEGMTAVVLMAIPCTKSLGGESRGHRHGGDEGRRLRWKFATLSGRQRAAVDILMLRERTMVCMLRDDGLYEDRDAKQTRGVYYVGEILKLN